jgi:hypothetical protein
MLLSLENEPSDAPASKRSGGCVEAGEMGCRSGVEVSKQGVEAAVCLGFASRKDVEARRLRLSKSMSKGCRSTPTSTRGREPTGKPTSAKSGGGFVPKPPRLLADYRLVGRNQVASTPSSSGAGPGPTYRPGHNRRKCDQPINRFLAFPDRLPRGAGAVEREVLGRPTVISSHSSLSEPVGLRADPRGARTD